MILFYIIMLYEIYLDAIRNKEKRILNFKDSDQDKIESEALSRWIKYNPLAKHVFPQEWTAVGISVFSRDLISIL